jgi:hypothetical protein
MKETLLELIELRVLEYGEPNGSMVQFEIDGLFYDVDYTSRIETKQGMKSGDYDVPNDSDELNVIITDVEIRNIYDSEGEIAELGNINSLFYIL